MKGNIKTNLRLILPSLAIITLISYCAVSKAATPIRKNGTDRLETIIKTLNNPNAKNILVASHRGDWRNFPENSLEGIQSAIDMGVDIVEIDLAMTKDSILVLMHDRNVDRTTTGKGPVGTYTLDSIKGLYLKNGCGIETDYKVPTLEEALMECKGKVVVNIDKGYQYYDQVEKVLIKTHTVRQALIKGSMPASAVLNDFSRHTKERMMYMPVIDFRRTDAFKLFEDYINNMPVIAYEVVWSEWTPEIGKCIQIILNNNAKLWTNSMWKSLCGGLNDDKALKDPSVIYGKHLSMGSTIIQTDRPEYLVKYLRTIGKHE